MAIYFLNEKPEFPDPSNANRDGLLAVGGDLTPERLLAAYERGIFPWYSEGDPILWWSTDPRLVLYPGEIKISRSLQKILRKQKYLLTFDHNFERVIHSCAYSKNRARQGTWITSEMIAAYNAMHTLGYAHSVEAWHEGVLVGGLYGISLGRCFFGESMFSEMSDASKAALVYLARHLHRWRFKLIDCQLPSDHLIRMGARLISRHDFLAQLRSAQHHPTIKGSWIQAM